jgi:hypothetical protein
MKCLLKRIENLYAAIAFAEAGEFDTARPIMKEKKKIHKRPRNAPLHRPGKDFVVHGFSK